MNPTREQFENAARFARVNISRGELAGAPILEYTWDGDEILWTPHQPSADAFRLMAKVGHWVAASSTRTHELAVRSGSVDAFFTARDSGDEIRLAEATFLLAAAIGETMK